MIRNFVMLGVLFVLSYLVGIFVVDDWLYWMGLDCDNVWKEDGIIDEFFEDGFIIFWWMEVVGGYLGFVVVDGRFFIIDYVILENVKVVNFECEEFSGIEWVYCFDEKMGDVLWSYEYFVKYGIFYLVGLCCIFIIEEEFVYIFGVEGNFFCFDVEMGDVKWLCDLVFDYDMKVVLWGYVVYFLIDGDLLFMFVGGEGSYIVVFDKWIGVEKWWVLILFE